MPALQPRQCPPKRGLRFATNAAMPSRASSVPYSTAPTAGSLLGGVGLMISAYRPHRAEAAGYALHVAATATKGPPAWRQAASPPITTSGRTQPPTRPRAVSAGRRQVQNEIIEPFGDHARWMSEPGPFLDDLDTIYRRR
jgi:hypothetical protein